MSTSAASQAAAATDGVGVHEKAKNETILVQGRRFNVTGRCGEGAFSVVYIVQDPEPPGKRYALKRQVIPKESDIPHVLEELERTQRLSQHPFICALHTYEVSRVDGKHYAQSLCQHGGTSLVQIMKDKQSSEGCSGLGQQEVLRLAFSIGSAISHLHHHGVAFRDLKPENVVDLHGVFRLVDFGSVCEYAFDKVQAARDFIRVKNDVEAATTLEYRAPEMADVYRRQRIDVKCDVWALGVMLYYVMYFSFPFSSALSILAGTFTFPNSSGEDEDGNGGDGSSSMQQQPHPEYDAALQEAVKRCLTQDPSARWSVDELLAFLGSAFPDDEKSARIVMQQAGAASSAEGEEGALLDPTKPRDGAGVKLVADGTIPVQERHPMLCDDGGGAKGIMSDDSHHHPVAEEKPGSKASSGGSGGGGALFSKLQWNAGGGGSNKSSPSSAPMNTTSTSSTSSGTKAQPAVGGSSSSSIDDLFTSGGISGGSKSAPAPAAKFDPFGAFGNAPASTAPRDQRQQQSAGTASGGAGGLDIFGVDPTAAAAAASAPKMSFGASTNMEQQKKNDPFENLFKK